MDRRNILMLGMGAAASAVAYAQGKGKNKGKGDWVYLGEANVDGAADHDRITVGRDEGVFRALQIQVERAPIEFNRVVVHYGNDQDERIELRDVIAAGAQSRIINLSGNRRAIQSVEFWYERAHLGSGKPRLALYGRR